MSSASATTPAVSGVPFVGFGRQHEALRADLEAAFARVLGSDGFILGAEADAFEREFAAYYEVEHGVGWPRAPRR
jgi:dTDP-4-amino-4,6-dideoxygalactose transaminase